MIRIPQLRFRHLHLFHLYLLRTRGRLSREVLSAFVDADAIGVIQFQTDGHLSLPSAIGEFHAYRHIFVVSRCDI